MPSIDEKARSLFLSALERGTGEWRAYLEEVCGGDTELRSRVDELLKAHQALGSIHISDGNTPGPTIDHPHAEGPGTRIGSYKLVELIGEGGMGVVYLAQQTEPVKRLVALKVIKAGMDSRQVLARFEAERQALALMDHPNIAKVLDAGTISVGWAESSRPTISGGVKKVGLEDSTHPTRSDGRPYFVMELVKGVPITRFCDERKLTPRERLELFLPVCHAIQHAHQKGIIHRDIKPTNVLVALYDGKPVPKVIDFGVAKATGQPLTEKTLVTGLGAVVGTPEYMSPEQAELNQLDIDTRSDIYSLGVLLYELLTGTTPLTRKRAKEAALLEVLRVIREEESQKPSTRLSTTDELPSIAANRGTEPARLSRLMRGELDWVVMKALEKDRSRRYETANGFAADVQRYLCGEAVLAVPPSAGYRLRKFARRNKARLAVTTVLAIAVLLGIGGIGWAVRDRAARHQEAERERLDRQGRLSTKANTILAEVERLQREQKWPEALALALQAKAAVMAGEADGETGNRVDDVLNDLTFVSRLDQIREDKAVRFMREQDPGFRPTDDEYAQAFKHHGADVENLSVEDAVAQLKNRPALARPISAALDDWRSARQLRFGFQDRLVQSLMVITPQIDTDPLRSRIDWLRRTLPPEPRTVELRRLADSINARAESPEGLMLLAQTLATAGAAADALRVLRAARMAHPDDFWLNMRLADHLRGKNDPEALRYYTAAVSLRPDSVWAQHQLAMRLYQSKEFAEAAEYSRRTLEIHPSFLHGHYQLGMCLLGLKQYDAAAASFRRVIAEEAKTDMGHYGLGSLLVEMNRPADALPHLREAIRLSKRNPFSYLSLAKALEQEGRLAEAIDALSEGVLHNPSHVAVRAKLATVYGAAGQWDKAAAEHDRAVDLDPANANGRYLAAIAHAGAGNDVGYRLVCRAMTERYADTDRSQDAERTASACLLAPEKLDAGDRERAQKLAERAVTGIGKEFDFRYFALTNGLADYRAGRHVEAVAWMRKYAPNGTSPHWDLRAYAVLAMARYRLGSTKEARAALGLARVTLAKRPNPKETRPYTSAQTHDWLYGEILLREAESLGLKKDEP